MSTDAHAGEVDREVAPVSPGARVQELDVLRGIALLGILLVNILDYAPEPASAMDRAAVGFIDVFADGSFYPLFSLLFGVGFAVFLGRAGERQANGTLLFLRRIAGLLAIAILQFVFLEDRSILLRYSFLGLLLLLFSRASSRVCFAAALVCLALAVAHQPIVVAVMARQMRDPVAAEHLREAREAARATIAAEEAEWERVAATRSYVAAVQTRAQKLPRILRFSANLRRNPTLLHILAMFLFGVAVWRSRILSEPGLHRRALKLAVVLGMLGGLVGNVLVSMGPDGDPMPMLAGRPSATRAITLIANTLLTLAYVAGIVLAMSAPGGKWRRRLAPFALVGRMGLTNYLFQSLAMSLLFLPYGLRLDETFPLWLYPLIALIIFLAHLPLSAWWLARYRFGPVEWVWRMATYGRIQSLRLQPAEALDARL